MGGDNARYFEEIEIGETYEHENARTISETDIANYAGMTGDFHPIHMSEPFAREETIFDGRIAHGNLVDSIVESLVMEVNHHSFSYGHDNVRFVNPVYIDDTLSASREVIDTEIHDEQFGRVVYKYTATNQYGETVLVNEHTMMVKRRGAERDDA
jgi:3-hydroxybutyryl-CoA dehydratase